MQDRKMLTIDVDALCREIRTAAKGIGPRQQRRAKMLQRLTPYYQDWYNAWLSPATEPFYVLNSRV